MKPAVIGQSATSWRCQIRLVFSHVLVFHIKAGSQIKRCEFNSRNLKRRKKIRFGCIERKKTSFPFFHSATVGDMLREPGRLRLQKANARKAYFLGVLKTRSKSAGKSTRLAMVAVTSVTEVNQPNAWVPPKPLKQKITKPAMSTIEV